MRVREHEHVFGWEQDQRVFERLGAVVIADVTGGLDRSPAQRGNRLALGAQR
jgi:hypothetical protein